MATSGEKFAVDEWVVWDAENIHAAPEAMAYLVGHITRYGPGPFRVVAVREIDDEAREYHTQVVTIRLDERSGVDLPYSGEWLTHVRH